MLYCPTINLSLWLGERCGSKLALVISLWPSPVWLKIGGIQVNPGAAVVATVNFPDPAPPVYPGSSEKVMSLQPDLYNDLSSFIASWF